MLTKFVVVFTILAVVAAIAGTVPGQISERSVTLTTPVTLNGQALKAGVYKVTVLPNKVTFTMGKQSQDVPAKVETNTRKFDQNQVQYEGQGAQTTVSQICLGGTKIRVIFN